MLELYGESLEPFILKSINLGVPLFLSNMDLCSFYYEFIQQGINIASNDDLGK